MSSNEQEGDIPVATRSKKKANLAQDKEIKSFWDTLVDDWLKLTNKVREKRNSKD